MVDVRFDFGGALELARRLHALAGWLDRQAEGRAALARIASAAWLGPHGDDFRRLSGIELDEAARLSTALRFEAVQWARAWADAVNEQNRRNRQRRVEEISAGRGIGEQLVDTLVGDDSNQLVRAVEPVRMPRPPEFLSTGQVRSF